MKALFSVVLHDVAPATWPLYADFAARATALGVPLTLLVVPDYHGQGTFERDPRFCATIERELARGGEAVLHGYYHADELPCHGPIDFVRRRLFTHEGEFAAISEQEALARLEQGLALFARMGWPVEGFVAPGWLLSEGAWRALARLPLRYTSSLRRVYVRAGEGWRPIDAPSLVWSARSGWRRLVSQAVNERWLRRSASRPWLRLGLHPVDMRHERARRFWERATLALLADRTPCTKGEALRALAPLPQGRHGGILVAQQPQAAGHAVGTL
jgi:predicted deacetylase